MKLISFSVNSYRSIQSAYKVSLFDYTVLVGPNNEGKSNLLRAMVLSLNVLAIGKSQRARSGRIPVRYGYRNSHRILFDFDWNRDFPVQWQEEKPDGRSECTLEFVLDDSDYQQFNALVNANLGTNLKVNLSFGKDDVLFDVKMPGRAKQALNEKKKEISDFIQKKLMVQYISAIRPSEVAFQVVEDLIQAELRQLADNPEYRNALTTVKDLQKPVLQAVAANIQESMLDFLPTLQSVAIYPEEDRYRAEFRREYQILIDDGVQTELSLKGDGVISLVTMSLIRHVTRGALGQRFLILAIEEPESHLHPQAIHQLKDVLATISKTSQVIITTHSPILIERSKPAHNIIVQGNRAQSAGNIAQIRESLGIEVSDNLSVASFVLLVEGEDDLLVLNSFLGSTSARVAAAMESGAFVIESLGGASKLHYFAQLYKNQLCDIHVFLDGDSEGKKAVGAALDSKRIEKTEYNITSVPGMEETEFEDLLKCEVYSEILVSKFQINIQAKPFKSNKKKWSDRIGDVAKLSGKIWSPQMEMEIKLAVAKAATDFGPTALHDEKRGCFDSLVGILEDRLK